MKALVLVFLLHILRLAKSAEVPEVKVSLDITQIDASKIKITSELVYGIQHLVLEGKEGFYVGSVTRGGQSMWKETAGKRFLAVEQFSRGGHQSIFYLHLVDVDNNALDKFFVDDGNLREIQMIEFQERTEAMKRGIAASRSLPGHLDIGNVDFARANVEEGTKDGVTHKYFSPKRVLFTKVFDLSKLVWAAKRGEKSPKVHLDVKGDLALLSIAVSGGRTPELYFEKDESGWRKITRKQFDASFEKFKREEVKESEVAKTEVPKIGSSGPVLNLEKVGPNVISDKGKVDGINYISYFLKDSSSFSGVVDKSLNIWAGNDYERCNVANIYKKGVAAYLSLRVRNGSKAEFQCFEKDGDKWRRISQQEFDESLYRLQENRTNKQSGIMTSGPCMMVLQLIAAVYFMNFLH
ncbi:signal peptide containing protein [Theileria equi strain WA]|uniref:Signal peptide containing protein n=1 Tax=Theileria equi strain WA TaxID=1537102 RepID=L1LEP5_THEEQ|nr:signal peptide containing protein [Theileria equi strain WA]EKX73801.1 signal peptide containing protein [Theileria equi strain WA]|eukprot:XP_004833253.1 signal peptide containing protein [Theileria equi strain WA]